jgi:hypothetical protein
VALAIAAVFLWNMAIYIDSSALIAGTVQAADPHTRGATMGLHSMSGYEGGFIGPLGVGFALVLVGGNSATGWGLAFGHIAVVTLMGLGLQRRNVRNGVDPCRSPDRQRMTTSRYLPNLRTALAAFRTVGRCIGRGISGADRSVPSWRLWKLRRAAG